jgi:hypothetical protein
LGGGVLIADEVKRSDKIKSSANFTSFHSRGKEGGGTLVRRTNDIREFQLSGCPVTLNLMQDRRQLRCLVCDGPKAQPLQGSAVKTAPTLAVKAAQLAATGD